MSKTDVSKLYQRLKIVCCTEWGIPPWEFEEKANQGGISFSDVWETYFLAASRPFIGENIQPFVFREKVMDRKKKLDMMQALVFQIKAEENPIIKQKLKERLEALNTGGKKK